MSKSYNNILSKSLVFLIITVIGLVVLEVAARYIWKMKYNELQATELHGHERLDYDRDLIVPIPGTVVTVADYRANLIKYNKTIGLKNFEATVREQGLGDDVELFRINGHGFKGPEIDVPKPNNRFRIVTIGDSVTWGSDDDDLTYPRAMEVRLNAWAQEQGCKTEIEVVNAGVMGYNFERVLQRLDEYLVAQPDVVTISLGWNRTIGRADPKRSQMLYRNLALYRIIYHTLINRTRVGFVDDDFSSRTYYDPDKPELAGYRDYNFDYDMSDLNRVVERIRAHNPNTQVIIITLAGLFDWRVEPDERGLIIAYPVAATDNLYAYPLLTRIYNDELRTYAQRQGLPLIDFEQYALEQFRPRSRYYIDSVHPTNETYLQIGQYFATKLRPLITPCI